MNPNELRKLKERAPLPILMIFILLMAPSFLLESHDQMLNLAETGYSQLLTKASKLIKKKVIAIKQKKKMDQLNAEFDRVNFRLATRDSLPDLIDKFYAISRKHSLTVRSVNYDFQKKMGKYNFPGYKISFVIKAGYSGMRKFLEEVENLDRPIIISEVVASENDSYHISIQQLVKS